MTPLRRAAVAVILFFAAGPAAAEDADRYQTPSPVITDIVLAAPTPSVNLGPDATTALILEVPSLPPIAELAERELRLAGLRIKPQWNGPSRTRPYSGLRLLSVETGADRAVKGLPAEPRIENPRWSADGTHVAFTHATATGIELWVLDVRKAEARRLTGPILNLVAGAAPSWLDGASLVCAVVPEARGPEPAAPTVPAGPVVQENIGKTAPARTYQDLLKNAYDEALFDHYFTAQLAVVALDGKLRRIGAPAVLASFSPSPDGANLLVETWRRPYSYLHPAELFPRRVEILDRAGKLVHLVAELPLQDEVPVTFGSVPTGRRDVAWRDDAPATLTWAEAQDGGDAGREAQVRDKVYMLAAPFDGEPVLLATLDLRYGGTTWGNDDLALVSSWWWKTRASRTWGVKPSTPATPAVKLFDHSFEDRYNDPGTPETVLNAWGRRVLLFGPEGRSLYLLGAGASDEGDRPFIDRLDLATMEKTRLFRSEAPHFEQPIQILDAAGRRVLSRREAVDDPPNYVVRDLADGTLRAVTAFPHPTPQLKGIRKELIRYTRKDGIPLTATLYLPAGYEPSQGPLPMVMWAYPQEFKSADAAGQVTDSPYRFVRVSWASPILWVARGYAVLDDPTMPIVGEGDAEPNDTYIEQLVASAEGAVDEVVRRGVAERGRIAIGGHSYGAFMTANLLAHSDLFAAGVARSGAYNRTLTPFGFQSEERTLWEAPEVYAKMSPFMYADTVNEPILLIHGEADNNTGTFPIQSERYYSALKGHGATARFVLLPHESHGYRGKESVLHMLWETEQWLDRYVKNAEKIGAVIGGE